MNWEFPKIVHYIFGINVQVQDKTHLKRLNREANPRQMKETFFSVCVQPTAQVESGCRPVLGAGPGGFLVIIIWSPVPIIHHQLQQLYTMAHYLHILTHPTHLSSAAPRGLDKNAHLPPEMKYRQKRWWNQKGGPWGPSSFSHITLFSYVLSCIKHHTTHTALPPLSLW